MNDLNKITNFTINVIYRNNKIRTSKQLIRYVTTLRKIIIINWNLIRN